MREYDKKAKEDPEPHPDRRSAADRSEVSASDWLASGRVFPGALFHHWL